ncbi:hypothetical protein XELAEV_18045003mg [Xenopus laevis]|uniref:Uncharacterized protein n=1 Tax=Xenopus laevis TaxID=8355 RepID=A0A974BZV9_XENLA|nr:hypothetical protein XELAEV_18045003mg [Xenopus laevis]
MVRGPCGIQSLAHFPVMMKGWHKLPFVVCVFQQLKGAWSRPAIERAGGGLGWGPAAAAAAVTSRAWLLLRGSRAEHWEWSCGGSICGSSAQPRSYFYFFVQMCASDTAGESRVAGMTVTGMWDGAVATAARDTIGPQRHCSVCRTGMPGTHQKALDSGPTLLTIMVSFLI